MSEPYISIHDVTSIKIVEQTEHPSSTFPFTCVDLRIEREKGEGLTFRLFMPPQDGPVTCPREVKP